MSSDRSKASRVLRWLSSPNSRVVQTRVVYLLPAWCQSAISSALMRLDPPNGNEPDLLYRFAADFRKFTCALAKCPGVSRMVLALSISGSGILRPVSTIGDENE